MTSSPSCPQCGATLPADAPAGLCPACLMNAGVPSQIDPGATVLIERPKPRDLPQVGETFGAYRIERELGHGGMGAVFAAEHLESGRRVALKVLSHKLDSPDARARFLREGRLAASINHPNSVYVFGTEEIEGTPVIAMELIAGGTLQERVQRRGPLPIGEAVDAVLQIIAGLEAAQAIGILHRDIKPANCFEDSDGTVKVGDFGLSISTQGRGESHLTLPGDFLGTPAFCPPEQLRGDELNVRSDMYSVGVTLFYLLTGRTPFEGKNMVQLLANALEKSAPSPTQFRPDVPRSLSRIVLRCLEKLPASRFGSYEELRRALTPFGSTAPTPATIGLRFVAEAIDHVVLTILNLFAPLVVFGDFLYMLDATHFRSPAWMWFSLGVFAAKALYYSVCEGVWGATPGKFCVGLRVARLNRSAPGIPRALARFALLEWPYFLVYLLYQYDPHAQESTLFGLSILVMWTIYLALMFSTVRRRNGFAAVHDLLTGTRVIQKTAYQPQRIAASADAAVATTETMARLGPFHVLSALGNGGGQTLQLGYDTRLLRKVWLRQAPDSEPPVRSAWRNLSRPTRLRWLQGQRDGMGPSWDAYEASSGAALLDLVNAPHPWRKVRQWLFDLASEVDAAGKDGTMPAVLALDRVWITAEDRAKLLDFPAPSVRQSEVAAQPCDSPQSFLNQVAQASLEGRIATPIEGATRTVSAPVPLAARQVLRELTTAISPRATAEKLQPLLRRMPEVSRRRRLMVLLGCALPVCVFGFFMAFGTVMMQGVESRNPLPMELRPCLLAYESMKNGVKGKGMENVPLPEEMAAMEAYIAGKFGSYLRDPQTWKSPFVAGLIPPPMRATAEKMVADHPQVSEADLERAKATLEPLLSGQIAKRSAEFKEIRAWTPVVLSVLCVAFLTATALASLFFALAFRGGLVFRVLGIAVVKEDGSDASRGRMFWRGLIAWFPLLLLAGVLTILMIFGGETGNPPPSAIKILTAVLMIPFGLFLAVGIASAMLRGRGLHDRLARTWLVPR